MKAQRGRTSIALLFNFGTRYGWAPRLVWTGAGIDSHTKLLILTMQKKC